MPSFSGYYFLCKYYGHRAFECEKRSRSRQSASLRNRNLVCQRCNAYGHKISECRNMLMPSLGYADKNYLAIPRNGIMYVIIVMVLAIKAMNVGIRDFSHMAANITNILNMEVVIEHMGFKDLHGTKGEVPLQDQEIHWIR